MSRKLSEETIQRTKLYEASEERPYQPHKNGNLYYALTDTITIEDGKLVVKGELTKEGWIAGIKARATADQQSTWAGNELVWLGFQKFRTNERGAKNVIEMCDKAGLAGSSLYEIAKTVDVYKGVTKKTIESHGAKPEDFDIARQIPYEYARLSKNIKDHDKRIAMLNDLIAGKYASSADKRDAITTVVHGGVPVKKIAYETEFSFTSDKRKTIKDKDGVWIAYRVVKGTESGKSKNIETGETREIRQGKRE